MEIKVEYLIIIDKLTSSGLFSLCKDTSRFTEFLNDSDLLVVQKNKISLQNGKSIDFELSTDKVKGKEQRFFYIKFLFNEEKTELEYFTKLLHTVKSVIIDAGGRLETLWDDVSYYYSEKSYKTIYKIENLLRKLITYFMLTNIGQDWHKETLPISIKEALSKSKRREYIDILHQIDFIDLSDLLFKTYQTANINELYEKISKATSVSDLELDELKQYVIKSNWEKYFSIIVDCDAEYLKERWKELYDLRCKVAHNGIIVKQEFERIIKLSNEVEEKLQRALDNISEVKIADEEKDEIAENIAGKTSYLIGEFIRFWKLFENNVIEFATGLLLIDKNQNLSITLMNVIKVLQSRNFIDDQEFQEFLEIAHFRNLIVHKQDIKIDESLILEYTERLKEKVKRFQWYWKTEIVTAMHLLGGETSLDDLYSFIESNTKRELPKSWKGVIRRVLQTHCSETDSYKGGEDLFSHPKKGYYRLKQL